MPRGLRTLVACLFTVGILSVALAWQEKPRPPADDGKDTLALLRDTGPRYWKGNLHTHSLWSDGDDFPEMIADWYKRNGYHFLALSDHNILAEGDKWVDAVGKAPREKAVAKYAARFGNAWLERRTDKDREQVRLKPLSEYRALLEESGRYLLLPAEEITHRYARAPVHINAVNLRDKITPVDGGSVTETMRVNLRQVSEQRKKTGWRTIASLNHPNFGWGIRGEDMILTEDLRFFEVFNGHPSVHDYGDDTHPSCERLWDIVLALRLGKLDLGVVYALATDDAHGYHEWGVGKVNPGRGWVMVRAPYLTPEAILRGLEAGDFYASTGVVLEDVQRDKGGLSLKIKGEKGVTYRTEFLATLKDARMESEARLDEEGVPLDVTRVYSAELGKVVAESAELEPSYRFTGKERYVRARVTSSRPHPNPYQKGDVEMCWTQPALP